MNASVSVISWHFEVLCIRSIETVQYLKKPVETVDVTSVVILVGAFHIFNMQSRLELNGESDDPAKNYSSLP